MYIAYDRIFIQLLREGAMTCEKTNNMQARPAFSFFSGVNCHYPVNSVKRKNQPSIERYWTFYKMPNEIRASLDEKHQRTLFPQKSPNEELEDPGANITIFA